MSGRQDDERSAYLTSSRWVHEETSEYLEDEGRKRKERQAKLQPRDATADGSGSAAPLAQFLNEKSRDTEAADRKRDDSSPTYKPIMALTDQGGQPEPQHRADGKEIVCGPLLNYRSMVGNKWRGSVLCVAKGGGKHVAELKDMPVLNIKRIPLRANSDNAGSMTGGRDIPWQTPATESQAHANILYSDPRNTFWQFDVEVEVDPELESKWEYSIDGLHFPQSATKGLRTNFFVPSLQESMRLLFFSCNGFSVGTDEDAWSGPALWNDVMRQQNSEAPFHVMLGGGDQIYNDGIRISGPLRDWTDIANPKKRRHHPYPETLRRDCDDWYLNNYIRWYNTDPFAVANGQIAQLNIWDDHDIIDGFGSYVDEFMMCDVFRGIGGTAHKYYMLFQHHLAPPRSTYVTDESGTSSTTSDDGGGQGIDANQLIDTYVAEKRIESCYIVGSKPGPYVAEHSYSLFAKLGARIAFAGIDARTERTRHQVNYPETYDKLFDRLDHELGAARDAGTPFRHLILLLGIPIAYPRLTWLENIFSSPLMGPIKFLNKRFGIGGSLFNKFDGSIDLLDDLDDHYTARTHKKERNALVGRLQGIAERYSVRITILGGDVHLAALGRFYSNPRLRIPAEKDARYMANVISSAIVNKPPPPAIANLLAKRNKIHHLNHETDETLLDLFNKDPGNTNKTAASNSCTMPSRNFAMITENSPNLHPAAAQPLSNGAPAAEQEEESNFLGNHGHQPLHEGELVAGTEHMAAAPQHHGRRHDGSLDICIRVEVNQGDREGRTEGYGLAVPALDFNPEFGIPERELLKSRDGQQEVGEEQSQQNGISTS